MKKLIQVYGGDWVDPERVSSIELFLEGDNIAYVEVTTYDGVKMSLARVSTKDAKAMRDKIAEQVNELRD